MNWFKLSISSGILCCITLIALYIYVLFDQYKINNKHSIKHYNSLDYNFVVITSNESINSDFLYKKCLSKELTDVLQNSYLPTTNENCSDTNGHDCLNYNINLIEFNEKYFPNNFSTLLNLTKETENHSTISEKLLQYYCNKRALDFLYNPTKVSNSDISITYNDNHCDCFSFFACKSIKFDIENELLVRAETNFDLVDMLNYYNKVRYQFGTNYKYWSKINNDDDDRDYDAKKKIQDEPLIEFGIDINGYKFDSYNPDNLHYFLSLKLTFKKTNMFPKTRIIYIDIYDGTCASTKNDLLAFDKKSKTCTKLSDQQKINNNRICFATTKQTALMRCSLGTNKLPNWVSSNVNENATLVSNIDTFDNKFKYFRKFTVISQYDSRIDNLECSDSDRASEVSKRIAMYEHSVETNRIFNRRLLHTKHYYYCDCFKYFEIPATSIFDEWIVRTCPYPLIFDQHTSECTAFENVSYILSKFCIDPNLSKDETYNLKKSIFNTTTINESKSFLFRNYACSQYILIPN